MTSDARSSRRWYQEIPGKPPSARVSYDIGSFELVRRFVADVVAKSEAQLLENGHSTRNAIDWSAVEACVADSRSFEHAIGRAVVIADQMGRGVFDYSQLPGTRPYRDSGNPFPALSGAVEALPAFGRGEDPFATFTEAEDPFPAFSKADDPFFAFSKVNVDADFGDEQRLRTRMVRKVVRIFGTKRAAAALGISLMLVLCSVVLYQITQQGPSASASYGAHGDQDPTGNADLLKGASSAAAVSLAAATVPPTSAPPSLADAPPLRSHEVFGFAPYWTLDESSGFNVSQLSTIAYFSIGVNPDGTLSKTGPGWNGYESQDLSSLVTRAHAAGDRVVLTVNSFDQSTLNQLTSSTSAPSTLATALIAAIQAKNLDGVNLDFEGSGSADQAGLTNLVTQVSSAIHKVNPHYQVTMDTYASAAGDSAGFYNIRALAPAVDGFFVMEYQPNLESGGSTESPLTSSMFSDQTTIEQYVAAAPAAKVLLGLPYFGIDWPTTNGTLTAQATGPATQPSYGQIKSAGHPVYWDSTTDTAWTSYQVGSQWHETFFEDPTSLYDATQMADANNLAGVGIWALGMDGNDPSMLSALLGFAPATKDGAVGPQATSASPTAASSTTTSTTSTTDVTTTSGADAAAPSTTSSASAAPVPPSTTTTTSPKSASTTSQPTLAYQYSGDWNGQAVDLTLWPSGPLPSVGDSAGQLTGFSTNDPTTSCLMTDPDLNVEPVVGQSDEYLVIATVPDDCASAAFTFTVAS